MKKILVLRGGALGDLIVTLPALSLLRQRWPAARIELTGNAGAAALAQSRGLIDAVHSQHEARWSRLYSESLLPNPFREWLASFDLIVNYWPDPDGTLRRHFPLRTTQQFLTAPAMPTRTPAAAHYCEPLRTLGLETTDYLYRLAIGPPFSDRVRHAIAIHPGSGSQRKNWPDENWRALIETLPLPVTLILGEAEIPRWSATSSLGLQRTSADARVANNALDRRNPPHSLVNRPLEDLITHFSQCRLFLGHDSGVSHLAAACGIPCILLFGPTDPMTWAPPAPEVTVIRRGDDLRAITVDEVQAAIRAKLAT
jgi:heptosyltransferase III